jgi:predicted aminopeptidase
MNQGPKKSSRIRKGLIALALVAVVGAVSGCQTLNFYRQALKGQYELLAQARPVQELLADPQTAERLKQRLRLLLNLRVFAEQHLKLPVDGHYRKYVDVHRPFVVWNVEAAPEFSMQPKSWWYPLVGRLKYRGYFSERGARHYAEWLKKKGWDVYIGGAPAYSTLGWFKDPALNTFIFERDADLAEVIFHELGHQRVFAPGDTDFNEAFATTVGQEGARRWLRAQGDTAAYEQYQAELWRTDQFVHLILDTRAQLEALYGDARTQWGQVQATHEKRGVPRAQLRRDKQRLLHRLQLAYAKLKAQWGGDTEYDAWFARQVNNAKLNSVAAYYDLLPGFQSLLKIKGCEIWPDLAQETLRFPNRLNQSIARRLFLRQTPTKSAPVRDVKLHTLEDFHQLPNAHGGRRRRGRICWPFAAPRAQSSPEPWATPWPFSWRSPFSARALSRPPGCWPGGSPRSRTGPKAGAGCGIGRSKDCSCRWCFGR